ncbi:MAG: GAF domain-containing protein [Gammaproteobacteria bacterium]|nr:GAF domain-containing protein [Gammaproteobacteria bacterium]
MQAPKKPLNEQRRLTTLRDLHILDTPRDARFDRFTRVSSRIFDTPIAVISLVDEERQWFKSCQGLDATETPRDISFCGHAILGDEVFEIEDAQQDPRFADNPLVVQAPNVRFYAGAPLKAPNGQKLGTLCIIDKVPRKMSEEDKSMLNHLANMVVTELVAFFDSDTGLANRKALLAEGGKCFTLPVEERQLELVLFSIQGVDTSLRTLRCTSAIGEKFSTILHEHFPAALTIAHLEEQNYCVLQQRRDYFNAASAAEHSCAQANDCLFGRAQDKPVVTYAGNINFDSDLHDSFAAMMRDADTLMAKLSRQH